MAVLARAGFTVGTRPPPRSNWVAILGGAECVWDDYAALSMLVGGPWPGLVLCVNDIGVHVPYLDHWVSLHSDKFLHDASHPRNLGWHQQREVAGLPAGFVTWGKNHTGVDRLVTEHVTGSSGLLGLIVASTILDEAGHERGKIVGCGVPMDKSPHFKESLVHPGTKPWGSSAAHWRAWIKTRMRARMTRFRSMSGQTAKQFGVPTVEWLNG